MPDAAVNQRPNQSRGNRSPRRDYNRPKVTPKTRKPTCQPPWPVMLVSGEEGSRKSSTAAQLSADERIAGMYYLEIGDGETTADEYGRIPGVKYEIIDHDGTWRDIMEQIEAHWQLAKDAEAAGKGPIALTVDAMSGVHSMLTDMADTRARRRLAAQLDNKGQDPDQAWSSEQEAPIAPDLWNLVKKRHAEFMHWVLNWPGPVVLISAEDVATVFDANDRPTKEKVWTLKCRKDLPKQVGVHIRMYRGKAPEIVKFKTSNFALAISPEQETWRPVQRPGMTLAGLIFDVIGCTADSRAANARVFDADQVMPGEAPGEATRLVVAAFRLRLLAAKTPDDVRTLVDEMQHQAGLNGNEDTTDATGAATTIGKLATQVRQHLAGPQPAAGPDVGTPAAGEVASAPAAGSAPTVPGWETVKPVTVAEAARDLPVTDGQLAELDKLFRGIPAKLADLSTREQKLFLARELVGRYLANSRVMTQGEVRDLMVDVRAILTKGDPDPFGEYFGRPQFQQPSASVPAPAASMTPMATVAAGAHA